MSTEDYLNDLPPQQLERDFGKRALRTYWPCDCYSMPHRQDCNTNRHASSLPLPPHDITDLSRAKDEILRLRYYFANQVDVPRSYGSREREILVDIFRKLDELAHRIRDLDSG